MDPHEDVNLGSVYPWAMELGFKTVKEYGESVKKYPNPPAPNLTRFTGK
jgi:arylsulfatase